MRNFINLGHYHSSWRRGVRRDVKYFYPKTRRRPRPARPGPRSPRPAPFISYAGGGGKGGGGALGGTRRPSGGGRAASRRRAVAAVWRGDVRESAGRIGGRRGETIDGRGAVDWFCESLARRTPTPPPTHKKNYHNLKD